MHRSRRPRPTAGRANRRRRGSGPAASRSRSFSCDRTRRVATIRTEPRVPIRIETCVVGIEVDEAPVDQAVTDLEHVAPAAGVRHPSLPLAVAVLAHARAFAGERVGARHDPVEVRVVMEDRSQGGPDVSEHLTDLILPRGDAPFWKIDLRTVREEVEDAAAGRGDAGVVERLQVLERHRSPIFIGHARRAHRSPSPRAYQDGRPASTLTQTDFGSVYSCIASKPISRPYPELRTPPNGDPGFTRLYELIQTIPERRPPATRWARERSLVHKPAPSPYSVPFAICSASSSSSNSVMVTNGPNTSSWQTRSPGLARTTVGST